MLQLKANKTSLYKLVSGYEPTIPPMRKTEFMKTPLHPSYWLEWMDGDLVAKAFLNSSGGSPILTITKWELYSNQATDYSAHWLDPADLMERGMVEEAPARK